MKQNLKNYLKIGILLFGISIMLVNCQQDDLTHSGTDAKEQTDDDFIIRPMRSKDISKNKALFRPSTNLTKSPLKEVLLINLFGTQ